MYDLIVVIVLEWEFKDALIKNICCYRFILEVLFTCTYNLVLYVFRAGIRRNNAEAIFAARLKSSTLMFGMNKTNYQKNEILDSLMRQSDKHILTNQLMN